MCICSSQRKTQILVVHTSRRKNSVRQKQNKIKSFAFWIDKFRPVVLPHTWRSKQNKTTTKIDVFVKILARKKKNKDNFGHFPFGFPRITKDEHFVVVIHTKKLTEGGCNCIFRFRFRFAVIILHSVCVHFFFCFKFYLIVEYKHWEQNKKKENQPFVISQYCEIYKRSTTHQSISHRIIEFCAFEAKVLMTNETMEGDNNKTDGVDAWPGSNRWVFVLLFFSCCIQIVFVFFFLLLLNFPMRVFIYFHFYFSLNVLAWMWMHAYIHSCFVIDLIFMHLHL